MKYALAFVAALSFSVVALANDPAAHTTETPAGHEAPAKKTMMKHKKGAAHGKIKGTEPTNTEPTKEAPAGETPAH